ncbi:hypothetical protein AVEN_131646-1, partial [Araneus ventricosus]
MAATFMFRLKDVGIEVASSLCWRVGALIKLRSETSDSPLWVTPPVWCGLEV